jgi:hypothetical protein
LGAGGRRFKSSRPDQFYFLPLTRIRSRREILKQGVNYRKDFYAG